MPSRFEHVGKLAHLGVQHLVGHDARVARFPFPHDGRLIPPRAAQMEVEAIVGDIRQTAGKPPGERLTPLKHFAYGLNQCNSWASLPQNPAGSVAASFHNRWYSAMELIRARAANSSDGGNNRSSLSMCKIVSGSCASISVPSLTEIVMIDRKAEEG